MPDGPQEQSPLAPVDPSSGPSLRQRPGLRFGLRRQALIVGGVLVGVIILAVLAAPWLAPYDPNELQDLAARRLPPGSERYAVHLRGGIYQLAEKLERTTDGIRIERHGRVEEIPAERVLNLTDDGVADRRFFLLGTDGLGRDLLSRILYGGRISLAIGLLAVSIALTVGVGVGALAALSGGWVDFLLMRGVDAVLAIPLLFLLLTLSSLLNAGTWTIALLLGGIGWMVICRLARADLLGLRRREFVLAARATGSSTWRILTRHLLANAWGPLVVQGTLLLGDVMLVEASMSFMGMGVRPPTPTWGNMIADGQVDLDSAWWISTLPGVALGVTVIAVNLFVDGLRDVLDPRQR